MNEMNNDTTNNADSEIFFYGHDEEQPALREFEDLLDIGFILNSVLFFKKRNEPKEDNEGTVGLHIRLSDEEDYILNNLSNKFAMTKRDLLEALINVAYKKTSPLEKIDLNDDNFTKRDKHSNNDIKKLRALLKEYVIDTEDHFGTHVQKTTTYFCKISRSTNVLITGGVRYNECNMPMSKSRACTNVLKAANKLYLDMDAYKQVAENVWE